MARPIKQRIQVHQDWAGDIPLKNLWGVQIAGRDGASMTEVGNRIQQIVDDYQPRSYQVEAGLIDKFSSSDEGYLLAQNIAMPSESLSINTAGIDSVGGLINGYYAANRTAYGSGNQVTITFLETNIDVIDYFIKPWIVATSYKGLIEDDVDIKCNITVTQYTRSDNAYNNKVANSQTSIPNPNITYSTRKIFNFFNCAPYNTQGGDQMSYNSLSISDIPKAVGSTFSHYEISNPN